MTRALRLTLHHAADLLEDRAETLRLAHLSNVDKLPDEWADLITTAAILREAAGERPAT